jgi:hypothetical protein
LKKIIYFTLIVTLFINIINITSTTYATTHTAGEVISGADNFLTKGESNASKVISDTDLKALSDTIYNILLVVGIVVAVIIGAVLGIKFMMEGAEGKAEVQNALVPYVIGCIVIFGAFTIWKIVVLVLNGLN